eukprot:3309769-Amphidinium_carterae.2
MQTVEAKMRYQMSLMSACVEGVRSSASYKLLDLVILCQSLLLFDQLNLAKHALSPAHRLEQREHYLNYN